MNWIIQQLIKLYIGKAINLKKRVFLEYGDIREAHALDSIIKKIKPDYFVHLAAIHHIPTCEKNRQLTQKVNSQLADPQNHRSAFSAVWDIICISNSL